MKLSVIFGFVSLPLTFGLPSKRNNGGNNDVSVLNFALTLEHLETAFYSEGLTKYSDADFAAAGFKSDVRGWYQQILAHEKSHVETITAVLTQKLGATPVSPCNYSFPLNDTKSFVTLSAAFETVGASAYTGALSMISDKEILTVAGEILSVEGRQSAWINSAPLGHNPWNGRFEIPLTMNEVFTIASTFIKSCPSSNPTLPVKPFPQLGLPGNARPGQNITLSFDQAGRTGDLFLVLFTADGPKSVSIAADKSVVLPSGDLRGTIFAIVSTEKDFADDSTTVAGPALLMIPFNENLTVV